VLFLLLFGSLLLCVGCSQKYDAVVLYSGYEFQEEFLNDRESKDMYIIKNLDEQNQVFSIFLVIDYEKEMI